jgi:hypothetical protein
MKHSTLYLLLAIPGFIVPWLFLFGFLASGEATPSLFVISMFANPVAGAVSADLLISALVFFVFLFFEGRRLRMNNLWLYPLLTMGIGLSFGLPLFLYARARVIELETMRPIQ